MITPGRITSNSISHLTHMREEKYNMSIYGKEKNLSIAYIGGGSRGWVVKRSRRASWHSSTESSLPVRVA